MSFDNNISGILGSGDSSYWSLANAINVEMGGGFAWLLTLAVWFLLFYYYSRRSQDVGKSFIQSNFVIALLLTLLYFGGKSFGVSFVPNILFLGVLVSLAIGVAIFALIRWESG